MRVVVFGQDPYPTAGHADGLAFSAGRGRPRSLARIFEVLADDRPGLPAPPAGSLDGWARQGVLLLNPVLTVEIGRAGSHARCGWQALTKQIRRVLCRRADPPVFLLWGAQAQASSRRRVPPSVRAARARCARATRPTTSAASSWPTRSHFAADRGTSIDWWVFDAEPTHAVL